MLSRRNLTKLMSGLFVSAGTYSLHSTVVAQTDPIVARAVEVEGRLNARLGFAAVDLDSGRRWSYHGEQRFPLCSTFKIVAAAAFLEKVDRGEDSLSRRVVLKKSDLVSYSPLTENRIGSEGLSMAEICEAAVTLSDNTAGNTILASLGGPAGVTQFARELGDDVFRLDRWETDLNEALIGDARDTSSPAAMIATLEKLLFGDVLSQTSKLQLRAWMIGNQTGDAKLRAGFPESWVTGDKTGGGNNGTMADVAFTLRNANAPLLVAVYMTETAATFDQRNAGIADIGRAIAELYA
ncbi:MAG: class A beta-lactamase [Pseudohongiellaceae bacterium]